MKIDSYSPDSPAKAASLKEAHDYLKKYIISEVLVDDQIADIPILDTAGKPLSWFCDFRKAFSDRKFLEHTATLFWHTFANRSLQIGGLESASLPLITALMMGGTDATGFFIRKSRKKKGQTRLIEGKLNDNEVVLVDDLINTGAAFQKQIEALEKEGLKVAAIFVIVQFYKDDYYTYLRERNIPVYYIFALGEFEVPKPTLPRLVTEFEIDWYFGPNKPHHLVQGPRYQPILTENTVWTGSDSGHLWQINQTTGAVTAKHKIHSVIEPAQSTLVNPIIGEHHLLLGTNTGDLVLYTKDTITEVARSYAADRITSPLVRMDDLAVCGTATRSSSVAHTVLGFHLPTQSIAWQRPVVGETLAIQVISDNLLLLATTKGHIYCLTLDGAIKWETTIDDSIHSKPALSADASEAVVIGTNGTLVVLDTERGMIISETEFEKHIYANLTRQEHILLAASLERELYCYDLTKKTLIWQYTLDGRSYAEPTVKDGAVYVGDNFGTLHKIDITTGYCQAKRTFTERICNPVQFGDDHLIVSTAANEVYRLHEEPIDREAKQ